MLGSGYVVPILWRAKEVRLLSRCVQRDQFDRIFRLHATDRSRTVCRRSHASVLPDDEFGRLDDFTAFVPPGTNGLALFAGHVDSERVAHIYAELWVFVLAIDASC